MLTAEQVTALTAQAAAAATYEAYDNDGNLLPDWQLNSENVPIYLGAEVSVRGVGIYGQTPESLTLAGYLKPGTLALITSPDMTITVLNTPAVWTGQYGINSLIDYLNDPILQNLAQNEIMSGAYQGLIDAGLLTGNESARYEATFLQPATRYGVNAVLSCVVGTADSDTFNNVLISARQGQYAIDFVEAFAAALNVAEEIPGFTNTVDRQDLDQAVVDIIGNSKIPVIEFADAPVEVSLPTETDEDGRFRFAPGSPKG